MWARDADGIADIHLQNILLGLRDHTVLRVIEDTESSSPVAVKTYDGYEVYPTIKVSSHETGGVPGPPKLADFGEAAFGPRSPDHCIQPPVLRAPEVVLGQPWSYPADMWNLEALVRIFLRGITS